MTNDSSALALEIVNDSAGLTVADPRLKTLAADIRRSFAAARTHAELAVLYAIHTGRLCNEAKAALPHGQFIKWIGIHCPEVSLRTAQNYMALAKAKPIADLPLCTLGSGELHTRLQDEVFREAQAEAIRGITEDRTLTQLYFDFGILKSPAPPAKRQHHPSKLTPEERVEARRARVLEDLYRSLNLIELVGFDEKGFNAMADGDLELYYGLLRDLAERIRIEQLAPRRRDAR